MSGQTTLRLRHASSNVAVPVSIAKDARVSLRARGVLLWLMTHPDGPLDIDEWGADNRAGEPALTDPQAPVDTRETADDIRQALRELQAADYLTRQSDRMPDGTLTWTLTVVACPSFVTEETPSSTTRQTTDKVLPEHFPMIKAKAIREGLGCTACENIGMVEENGGSWRQCPTCSGTGVRAS